jgi:hypothetical protein
VIRHVVMFRWADGAPHDVVEQVGAALRTLPPLIPEIRRYEHGPDAGLVEGNHDYVVVADFDSVDDFLTYRNHPEHQRLIRELFGPVSAARTAVQYELP